MTRLQAQGVPLIASSIADDAATVPRYLQVMDRAQPVDLSAEALPHGSGTYCNFWRQDDWSGTAYFYLDRPENGLPPVAPVAERVAGL